MTQPSRSYQDEFLTDLSNPEEAVAYLNAALEEGVQAVFLLALRNVADAYGIKRLSEQTHLNRESMDRMLSDQGNPQLSSLIAILESLGLRLTVEARETVSA